MGFGHRIQGLQPWAGSRIAVEESVCLSKTDPNTPCGEKMVIKMIHTRKPFEDMVNVMKACLGDSFKKESSALGSLCELIQAVRPKKLVKIGGADDIDLIAIIEMYL